MGFNPQTAINGTYGTLMVNGMEVLEFEGMTAEMEIETAEINQPKDLYTGYKQVGIAGNGEFTITRLNQVFVKEWAKAISKGEPPELVFLVNVDDPASEDTLTVALKNITLENVPVVNLEPKTVVKDTYKFKFGIMEFPE